MQWGELVLERLDKYMKNHSTYVVARFFKKLVWFHLLPIGFVLCGWLPHIEVPEPSVVILSGMGLLICLRRRNNVSTSN